MVLTKPAHKHTLCNVQYRPRVTTSIELCFSGMTIIKHSFAKDKKRITTNISLLKVYQLV